MRIFAENPGRVMERFSADFEKNFVASLSRRHGTKRVAANVAYQEYIADRHHVHMNSTRWETLTKFVQYLGKSGQCVVDETEKGWFIQWIDRDPAALARLAAVERREADDEERLERDLRRRVRAAEVAPADAPTARGDGAVATRLSPAVQPLSKRPRVAVAFRGDDEPSPTTRTKKTAPPRMLDALMRRDIGSSSNSDARSWIVPGIVVKIRNRRVGEGAFYKRKGTIESLVSDFVAVVVLADSKLQLDQDDLETVIPAPGKLVKILRGNHRGQIATLLDVDETRFAASIRIVHGERDAGTTLDHVDYETVSKLAT